MQLSVGSILEGKVTGITKFGAFVELPEGKTGMVHISEVASTYVKEISEHIKENDIVKVKVLSISDDGKVSLSMKKAQDNPPPQAPRPREFRERRDNDSEGSGSNGGGGFSSRPPQQRKSFSQRPDNRDWSKPKTPNENMTFEDMMSKFKQTSDDKMYTLKKIMDVKKPSGSRKQHKQ